LITNQLLTRTERPGKRRKKRTQSNRLNKWKKKNGNFITQKKTFLKQGILFRKGNSFQHATILKREKKGGDMFGHIPYVEREKKRGRRHDLWEKYPAGIRGNAPAS